MSSIDRYDWHLNENFPSNLPKENSATHIGFFVHWIIENNLINDEHKNDLTDGLQNVLNRKITGRDFLFNFLDGKLWFSDLNNEGKLFAEYYYLSNQYFDDYVKNQGKKQGWHRNEYPWANRRQPRPRAPAHARGRGHVHRQPRCRERALPGLPS